MRGVWIAILTFGVSGLIGPLVRLATWPPSKLANDASTSASFVYDLVFLLWPAQLLAVAEASVGQAAAIALAVGTNVILFALVGVMVGLVAKRPAAIVALYALLGVSLLLFGLWGAGFSTAHLNWLAFLVALLVYAIPFLVVGRIAGNPPDPSDPRLRLSGTK